MLHVNGRSIVVGTDGSAAATFAVRQAALLARGADVPLHVVSASSHGLAEARSILDGTKLSIADLDVHARMHGVHGDPVRALCDVATRQNAGLIAVGNRGSAKRLRVLRRPFCDRVQRRACCSVMVVDTGRTGRLPMLEARTTMGPQARTGALSRISIADCVTLGNGICGVLAIATALGGLGAAHAAGLSHGRLVACAALIVLGAMFDVADGAVAHARGGSGMGDALDSMCDTVTFGVAPAIVLIASTAGEPGPWHVAAVPVGVVLVVAAMLRLARHSTCPAPPGGGFYGLTTPAAAGAVMALVFLDPAGVVLLSGALVVSILMLSEIHYPHQDRRTIPPLCAYCVAVVAALAGLLPVWPVALAWLIAVPVIPLVANGRPMLARAARGVTLRQAA